MDNFYEVRQAGLCILLIVARPASARNTAAHGCAAMQTYVYETSMICHDRQVTEFRHEAFTVYIFPPSADNSSANKNAQGERYMKATGIVRRIDYPSQMTSSRWEKFCLALMELEQRAGFEVKASISCDKANSRSM